MTGPFVGPFTELGGRLRVGQATAKQAKDLQLTGCEGREVGVLGGGGGGR